MKTILKKITIIIQDNNRKRYVFGNVSYTHRQQFIANYNDEEITFLLIDPKDKRTVVTLLHMPIQTTEKAIRHIFSALDEDCVVSDVKVAPGSQMRHDRWQLLLECQNKERIPDSFILSKMGIEGEDIVVKVFLEGRNRHLHEFRSNQQTQTAESEHPPLTTDLSDAARPPSPRKETEHPPQPPVSPPPSPQNTMTADIETSIPTPAARPRPTPSPHEDWKRTRHSPHSIGTEDEESDNAFLTPKEQCMRNMDDLKERSKLARERWTDDGVQGERKRRERAANSSRKTMHDYFHRDYRHY